MSYTTYNCDALTGGASRALDSISVSVLVDKDRAIIDDSTYGWLYFTFNATSTDEETISAHPFKIRPDDYSTAGVWEEIIPSQAHTRSHAITSSDDHTSTSTENVIQKANANGLPVDSAITEDASDNVLLAGAAAAGTSAAKVIVSPTGTAPTTCPADVGQMWVADRDGTAGQAAWHVKAGEEYNVNLALGANLVHFAKEQMIASVKQIVTSGIELFLVFDEYGAISTIADRSGNGRDATLRDASLNAINASTCSPALYGLAPHLSMNTTHVWDVADNDAFSFGAGGTDQPFSIIVLGYFASIVEKDRIIGKCRQNTSEQEYIFDRETTNLINFRCFDASGEYIGYRTTALTVPGISSIISTYDASKADSGINIYINGANARNSTYSSGTYGGMSNGGARLASYFYGASGNFLTSTAKHSVIMVVSAELTATQVAQLDAVLRSWAGVMI